MAKYHNEYSDMKREKLQKAITEDIEGKNNEAIAALKAELLESISEHQKAENKAREVQGVAITRILENMDSQKGTSESKTRT